MLFLLASGAVPSKVHRRTCKVTKKNWNMKEKYKKMHFFSKIFGHIKKKAVPLHPLSRRKHAGCSSARLECLLWEQEVVSSNLAIPTNQKQLKIKDLWMTSIGLLCVYIPTSCPFNPCNFRAILHIGYIWGTYAIHDLYLKFVQFPCN